MPSRTATHQQVKIIADNWKDKTIPQLMKLSGLTRHLTIGVCVQSGFTPQSAVRTASINSLHEPNPRKIKRYIYDDNGIPRREDSVNPETRSFTRPAAQYSNNKSLYKELER